MNIHLVEKHFYPHRILDIGANIGQFHSLCKNAYPDSYIYSIEPSEDCAHSLSTLTENFAIKLLGKKNQIVDFYTSKHCSTSTGNSIYRENTKYFSDEETVVVKRTTERLDDIFGEDEEFDLIKMDTQGSELDIIEGGLKLVSKAKGVLLEIAHINYNEGAPQHDEVVEYMGKIGFYVAETLEEHWFNGELTHVDYLFLKK